MLFIPNGQGSTKNTGHHLQYQIITGSADLGSIVPGGWVLGGAGVFMGILVQYRKPQQLWERRRRLRSVNHRGGLSVADWFLAGQSGKGRGPASLSTPTAHFQGTPVAGAGVWWVGGGGGSGWLGTPQRAGTLWYPLEAIPV